MALFYSSEKQPVCQGHGGGETKPWVSSLGGGKDGVLEGRWDELAGS